MPALAAALALAAGCGVGSPGSTPRLGPPPTAPLPPPPTSPPPSGGGTFVIAATLAQGLLNHTTSLLASGKLLIAGGSGPGPSRNLAPVPALATTYLFDPATNAVASGPPLGTPREAHAAILLPSGKVLLAGGEHQTSVFGDPGLYAVDSTEIYDPAANAFTPGPWMSEPRAGPMLALFQDAAGRSKVLIAGGYAVKNGFEDLSSADVYDPATNTITPAAAMPEGRMGGAAIAMAGGDVLIVGGTTGAPLSPSHRSASVSLLFDGWTGAFAAQPTLRAHAYADAAAAGGAVLAVGGYDGRDTLSAVERFDGVRWTYAPSLWVPRSGHTATDIGSQVLVVGGFTHDPSTGVSTVVAESEILVPGGQNLLGPSLHRPRAYHTATALPGGGVAIVGGYDGTGSGGLVREIEIYR